MVKQKSWEAYIVFGVDTPWRARACSVLRRQQQGLASASHSVRLLHRCPSTATIPRHCHKRHAVALLHTTWQAVINA